MKRQSLPNKPSAILKAALTDLMKVEQNRKFKINMGTWYEKKNSGTCEVCHAGAVMACRLSEKQFFYYKHDKHLSMEPSATKDRVIAAKLYFINNVRIGLIATGVETLFEAGVLDHQEYTKAKDFFGPDFVDGLKTADIPDEVQRYDIQWRKTYRDYIQDCMGMFKAIGL